MLALIVLAPGRATAQGDPAPVASPADSVAPPASDLGAFFAAFLAQRPDSARVARVTGLVLERDAGRFFLEEGDLWLATPVAGRVCAAVFHGRGTFSLAPPTSGERDQLRRAYGVDSLRRAFDTLVLVAADSTPAELSRGRPFRRGADSKEAARALSECLRFASDRRSGTVEPSLAKPFLEGRADGSLFTMIDCTDGERLFFEIDPRRGEEVALRREPARRYVGLMRVWRRDDVCMFPRAGARDSVPAGDTRPDLAVIRHRLECHIAGDMGFRAIAEVECESRDAAPQRWAALRLYDRLSVDSVAWSGGTGLRFFRPRESDRLWVRCDPPLAPGERRTLRIAYRGPLIERVGDWMLLGTSTEWYPEPDGRHRAPFELTFHGPAQYHLVSVGERVSSDTLGGVITSRWRSRGAIRSASFVLGLFDEEAYGVPDAPPVTALMFRGNPQPIRLSFGDVQVVSGARMDRAVASDVARAVAFFTRKLGPPPVSRITVAEIPDTKGEAFPGLVQLAWNPFWGRHVAAAEDAVFRAHEVAHQWWGHGVDYRTYHDHWLSEGFADFAGLWYLEEELGNRRSLQAVLQSWREQIFEDTAFRPKDSPPPGPISLGYRSARVEVPGDHALIVYKKGAWVLHMLRNMLLDLETGSDDRFDGLMRDFYARHEGAAATTADFRRIAERYAGQDLGWFFDQWVHGTELPTYRVAHRTRRTPEGRYQVTCRVEQRGVPEGFRMPVPIRIDLAGGRSARMRVTIQGARSEFDLPPLDEAPRAVTFNDLESVLCRVQPVKW
jgi:hypothetical protein